MSEIKRPVITKEQADALLGLYAEEWSKEHVLEYHVTREWTDRFSPLNDLDLITLAAALINGYEVEKTPEEKVREYYESHGGSPSAEERKAAIRETLYKLGIKIEGVNA
ncbi:hypothetical protein QNH18_16990 [Bacillus paralicheniformis]|uniref:hypothetical protein n=1 Tax=Bacillus paralicheniformis TaxID=1648923 RepID=UPI000D028605|nr:hypothetical protein [Bacillus paralicheniformis]PRS16610.1 hypothetical protein C6W27_09450 [Bacillus paralicheniformis]WHX85844.1 hypothetical protein QNH18_16990 [Bacillus paralicheniformis]